MITVKPWRVWHSARVARVTKALVILAGLLLCVILVRLAITYRTLSMQSAAADQHSAELERIYQRQLAEYQSALRVGTSRSEVLRYLALRGVKYGINHGEITLDLGDEPAVFPCDRWRIFLAFDFGTGTQPVGPSPQDALSSISLKRIGHCL